MTKNFIVHLPLGNDLDNEPTCDIIGELTHARADTIMLSIKVVGMQGINEAGTEMIDFEYAEDGVTFGESDNVQIYFSPAAE